MARAFGDFCLKEFGLISTPDIYHHHVTEKDEFVILATDGVWDVLSNKEAVDIVSSAPGRSTGARALVDCATRAWRLKYPTSKMDDCAVVCLFLDDIIVRSAAQTTLNDEKAPEEVEKGIDSRDRSIEETSEIEIVPVVEESSSSSSKGQIGQSKRSLAECISTAEDEEEWSALEGITRVNSLLSVPRFLPRFEDVKRSTSLRKWL